MKLNWVERCAVNNPVRVMEQRLEIKHFKRMASLRKDAMALEIGCGRGAGARIILKEFGPAHLHIMDLDIRMIQLAKAYLSPGEKRRVSFHVGDGTFLPFQGDTMDAVFGFGFLHHVPDWRRALLEIHRILKKEGIYFMEEIYPTLYQNVITRRIVAHPREDRFSSKDLRAAMDLVGLSLRGSWEFKNLGILGVALKSG